MQGERVWNGKLHTILSDKFSGSLESLRIEYREGNRFSGRIKFIRESLNGRLNLANVRKLETEGLRMYCLDYMLGMKDSLEELIIICYGVGSNDLRNFTAIEKREIGKIERNQVVKFLGYHDKMLESNIWSMFPKLKIFRLMVREKSWEFKREDWVKMSKNRKKVLN